MKYFQEGGNINSTDNQDINQLISQLTPEDIETLKRWKENQDKPSTNDISPKANKINGEYYMRFKPSFYDDYLQQSSPYEYDFVPIRRHRYFPNVNIFSEYYNYLKPNNEERKHQIDLENDQLIDKRIKQLIEKNNIENTIKNSYDDQKINLPDMKSASKLTEEYNNEPLALYQQGGQMNAGQKRKVLMQAFAAAAKGDIEGVAQLLGIKSEEELKQFVALTQQASQQKEDPEMAQLAQQALKGMQSAFSQAQKAQRGAKLNYIKMLYGKCPEGYEMISYKVGGKICKKCQKIEEVRCGKKMEKGGDSPIVTEFKNKRRK